MPRDQLRPSEGDEREKKGYDCNEHDGRRLYTVGRLRPGSTQVTGEGMTAA